MTRLSLVEAMALVPDPRSRHGRIHPLVAVLGLTVTAMLAGCKSLDAIAPFGRDRGLALAAPLGFRRAKTPNKSALGKIFRRLDVAALDAALLTWLDGRGATTGHVALDCKTLTGSADGTVPGRHLVAAYATEHAAVVGQLEMARTTNEHKTALQLLGVLPLAGRIVTADQCDLERQTAKTLDKGHDRIEKRRITTTTALNDDLTDWPHLAQVIRVERERRINGTTTVEIVYFITSLKRSQADATRLLALIRAHWEIENRVVMHQCVDDSRTSSSNVH